MKFSRMASVAVISLALTACGSGSDSTADTAADTPDATEVDEVSDDTVEEMPAANNGEPGLTLEEINDDTLEVVGSYDIDGDRLADGVDGPPSEATVEVFDRFTSLIPAEFRDGVVVTFVAIDQEGSGGTDGALQDVYGAGGEPTGERYLALDISGSSEELERTIVHEMGHSIFTIPITSDPAPIAADFNEAFAPGADYEPELFVTEYAASSPADGGEDIAESWAMFVLGETEFAGDADDDGELDVVSEATVAAEKVAFFEDYPELVQLKADILKAVAAL